MRLGTRLLGTVCLAALGLGCKPGPFDDLAKKAPVQAFDIPGTVLLGLRQGQGSARGTLLAATPGSSFVVDIINFDGSGKADKSRFPGGSLADNTTYSPVVMVEVPKHESAAWVIAGTPLVAAPNTYGNALLLNDVLAQTLPQPTTELLPVDGNDSHFGRGAAISSTTGDLLVSSELLGPTGFLDGDTRTTSKKFVYKAEAGDTCTGGYDANFAASNLNGASVQRRAMLEWQPRTATSPAIFAAGDPVATGTAGGVSFFTFAADVGIRCLGRLTSSDLRFGQALAMGDFNGDGVADLAVGAPPKNVYVFFGPLAADKGVVSFAGKATLTTAASTTFGTTLLAFTPDGSSRAQLAVGDYGATVEGNALAGAVGVYGFGTGLPDTGTLAETITDPSPEGNAGFGQGMTLLPFCRAPNAEAAGGCEAGSTANLLVIGGPHELFVFFNRGEHLGGTDAREGF